MSEVPGKTSGVAAVRADGHVLFSVEVAGRPDLSEQLTARRPLRRGWRYRKTRYRKLRFHRTKPSG